MTGQPAPNNAGQMAPASTTNYSVQNVGAAIQRRRAAGRQAAPVQEARTDDIARVADLYDAPSVYETPQAAPQARQEEGRPLRLSDLAAAVSRAKRGQRSIAEARDPDGADDGGYDPSEIVRNVGSSAGVAASVVASMQRRR